MLLKGFTLLEVMVLLVITASGLLCLLNHSFRTLVNMENVYFHQQAFYQAFALRERIRANQNVVYQKRELEQWHHDNQELLPSGHGIIEHAFHCCVVTLLWQHHGLQKKWKIKLRI